jgi:Nucleotidyl transferase of unknown function (DUF2204)
MACHTTGTLPHSETHAFYSRAIAALVDADIPFLVGGAYAFARYTTIQRDTKDFDIFMRPRDVERALLTLAAAGYETELTFPSWLVKAVCESDNIDIIFNSANGITPVDEQWLVHAVKAEILGMTMLLCPVEEMIWSKAFVMGRERNDSADVAHLLHAQGARLDWGRLLERFGAHWRVLLSHLILFGFIYPSERDRIPVWVIEQLVGLLQHELISPAPQTRTCQGTLLSWDQYLSDVDSAEYLDSRLKPRGWLIEEDISHITATLRGEKPVMPGPGPAVLDLEEHAVGSA